MPHKDRLPTCNRGFLESVNLMAKSRELFHFSIKLYTRRKASRDEAVQ